jgi:hypothetical protein
MAPTIAVNGAASGASRMFNWTLVRTLGLFRTLIRGLGIAVRLVAANPDAFAKGDEFTSYRKLGYVARREDSHPTSSRCRLSRCAPT